MEQVLLLSNSYVEDSEWGKRLEKIYNKTIKIQKKPTDQKLTDQEWSILLALDGKKNNEMIAQMLQFSVPEIDLVLQKLKSLDLVKEVKSKSDRVTAADDDLQKPDRLESEDMQSALKKTSSPEAVGVDIKSQEITLKPKKEAQDVDGKKALLHTVDLVKIYGKRTVVNKTSLSVKQGEIVGLLGPNGAGKTTNFYMITGLIRPNSGKIFLDEEDITKLAMFKRARRGIAYLPQEPSIFRKLSVEENLMAIMQAINYPKAQRKNRGQELMEELSISHIAKNKGYNLSGGERRRTEIARTLVNNPKFILLDEPFAGVDPIAVEDIQNIVVKLKEKGIGVLITDHNVHETLSITNHAYLLFGGKILKEGDSEYLANDPEARKLYLGDKFQLHR